MWKEAASCFLALVNASPKGNKDPFLKRQKALYLQYAARCYSSYAKAQEGVSQRAYYYELAAVQLRRYLDEKLCDKVYQCRNARGLLQENESKIGYANLVFAGGQKPVSVKIKGFALELAITVQGQSSQKIRPGAYQLEIQEEGQASKQQNVLLSPGQTMLLRVGSSPVVVRKIFVADKSSKVGPPTGAYVLMGIGGGLLLVGAGMGIGSLVRSYFVVEDIDNARLNLERNFAQYDTEEHRKKLDGWIGEYLALEPINISGWVILGVGSAVFVGGLVWMLVTMPKASPSAKTSSFSLPRSTKAHSVRLWTSTP